MTPRRLLTLLPVSAGLSAAASLAGWQPLASALAAVGLVIAAALFRHLYERDRPVKTDAVLRLSDWHAPDCACPSCVAPDPLDADVGAAANRAGAHALAGFAVGLLICALLDLATGRHGLLLMLGLR